MRASIIIGQPVKNGLYKCLSEVAEISLNSIFPVAFRSCVSGFRCGITQGNFIDAVVKRFRPLECDFLEVIPHRSWIPQLNCWVKWCFLFGNNRRFHYANHLFMEIISISLRRVRSFSGSLAKNKAGSAFCLESFNIFWKKEENSNYF